MHSFVKISVLDYLFVKKNAIIRYPVNPHLPGPTNMHSVKSIAAQPLDMSASIHL